MGSKLRIVVAAAFALAAVSASAQEAIGVVKRWSGQVAIERDGVSLAPTKGVELVRGDRLITGSDGYAHIKLHGAAPLSVSPDADISLDRYLSGHAPPHGLLERLTSFLAVNRLR